MNEVVVAGFDETVHFVDLSSFSLRRTVALPELQAGEQEDYRIRCCEFLEDIVGCFAVAFSDRIRVLNALRTVSRRWLDFVRLHLECCTVCNLPASDLGPRSD